MLSSPFIAGLILGLQALVDISLTKLSTKSTLTCAAAVCHSCFIFVEGNALLILLPSFRWLPTSRIVKYFILFIHSSVLVTHHGSSRCLCCAPRGSMSLYKGNKFEKDDILLEHASFFAYVFWKINQLGTRSHNGTAKQYCSSILGFLSLFCKRSHLQKHDI